MGPLGAAVATGHRLGLDARRLAHAIGVSASRAGWLLANAGTKYSIAWVTSVPVSKANVAQIAAAGRARWKIENETFNVMKNHGYELEHNFGHAETFLAMTLAALNVLAFGARYRRAALAGGRQAAAKRSSFFAHILTLTSYVVFASWLELLEALATLTIPPELLHTQKIE